MNYLITGVSAVGKTTVHDELIHRGHKSFDVDAIPNLSRWEDKSGKPVDPPSTLNEQWYYNNTYNWDQGKIEELLNYNRNGPLFVCGVSSNIFDMFDLFDHVFLLSVSEGTLLERARTHLNMKDKPPEEQRKILIWLSWFEPRALRRGATPIDANSPVGPTVDRILSRVLDAHR